MPMLGLRIEWVPVRYQHTIPVFRAHMTHEMS